MSAPVPFDEFMHAALYGSEGFYATGRGAGRHRDFITSPEIGPLFGAVVAHALDEWWDELGHPDPFVVIEAAAGTGALERSVVAAAPRCAASLRYVPVEFADPWPEGGEVGVIIANELLDNLAFKIVERTKDAWVEVLVEGDAFALGAPVAGFDHVDAPVGSRLPWHTTGIDWLARAHATFTRGRIVLVDYGTPTAQELVGRQWLRTYQQHGRGFDPLRAPGEQDITTDVAFDQLVPDRLVTQADWLRAHGIDALVDVARATWHARAAIGDLAALKARSRVNEADALLDPGGPGGFLVAEWDLS